MPEDGIIEISTTQPRSPTGEEIPDENNDTEAKLTKKAQNLVAEKEKLQQQVNRLQNENEGYRETIDEIKAECGELIIVFKDVVIFKLIRLFGQIKTFNFLEEISAFLSDDKMMKKYDRVFYVTRERTLAPGRILEMRRKLNSTAKDNSPFAIIKLVKLSYLEVFISIRCHSYYFIDVGQENNSSFSKH